MRPNTPTLGEAPAPAPPRRASRRRTALRLACVTPPVLVSTFIVGAVSVLLPDWAGSCVFYGGLAVAILLGTGRAETVAVRLLFSARKMTRSEDVGLSAVVSQLCHLQLGPPLVDVYVSRRRGGPHAVARGGRSVIMSAELAVAIQTGRIAEDEAVAVLAHAGGTARSGLVRLDPLIAFWTLPWRVLATVGRPARGLVGFAWKIRPVVIGVAIWQTLTDPPAADVGDGVAIAVVLAVALVLTYAWPRMTRGWDQALEREGDQALIERGLGRPLATFLRRLPQTPSVIERTQTLDPPVRPRPALRVVGS